MALLLWLWLPLAHAFTIDAPLDDPKKEALAKALFTQLRCVVCEGQSLATSNVEIAIGMRAAVRDLVDQGKTQDEVLQFMQQRYGNGVLLNPPLMQHTMLLWGMPVLLLMAGVVILLRKRRA